MTEALIHFMEKLNRKAERNFLEQDEVSFEQYHDFVNYKMGTDFHENYVKEFYQNFLERRKEKKLAEKR